MSNPIEEMLASPAPPQIKSNFVFSREKCLAHIDAIYNHLEQFKGKRGMNPYLWIARNVTPLTNRLEGLHNKDEHGQPRPEETEELQTAILKLRTDAIPKYGIQPEDEEKDSSMMKKQLPTLGRTF